MGGGASKPTLPVEERIKEVYTSRLSLNLHFLSLRLRKISLSFVALAQDF
jgi:hypothetical protein